MKIPFWILPGSWGLKGKTREIARAEYELSGMELEYKLANIKYDGVERDLHLLELDFKYDVCSEYDYDIAKMELCTPSEDVPKETLRIDFKHKRITEYEYLSDLIPLTYATEQERIIASLDLDLKFHKISEREYDKQMHTIAGKPWVDFIKMELDESKPNLKGIELDWNDIFIEEIQNQGFLAPSPEACVDMWLAEQFKNAALSELQDFMTADEIEDFDFSVKHNRKRGDDGKTEIS